MPWNGLIDENKCLCSGISSQNLDEHINDCVELFSDNNNKKSNNVESEFLIDSQRKIDSLYRKYLPF